jgi:hypothetical protein
MAVSSLVISHTLQLGPVQWSLNRGKIAAAHDQMFLGHLGVALMAKPIAPRTSVGTLMLASALPDLLAFVSLMAGIEHFSVQPGIDAANALNLYNIPLSHSLAMDVVWGAMLAAVYFFVRRYSRGAWVIFLLVPIHWLLDFASHRPDMSLAPGVSVPVGLGFYNSMRATLIVEGVVWSLGIIVYVYSTYAKTRAGIYAFWAMVALVTFLWATGRAGPPPPNVASVEITNVIIFSAVVAWAYWIDQIRPLEKQEFSLDRIRF